MNTRKYTPVSEATRAVAAHILANRRSRGWSVRRLSEELTKIGWPLNADAITRIEATNRSNGASHVRRVSVDDLAAFAKVFGADPAALLAAPDCGTCNGAPPVGFTCQSCGKGAQ